MILAGEVDPVADQALCTVVVPFRASAPERRRNLDVVLAWVSHLPVEVIVVEHDTRATLQRSLPAGIDYIHIQDSGPFAKAVACNAGFARCGTPVVAFLDADILLDGVALLTSADRCRRDLDMVRPFGRLVDLDAETSREVAATGRRPEVSEGDPSDARGSEHIPLCGGAFVMRRTAYATVGGMDESFRGWGGEDDALSVAISRLGLRHAVVRRRAALHLWHPRAPSAGHDSAYMANLEQLRFWQECTPAQLADAVLDGQRRLGEAESLHAKR